MLSLIETNSQQVSSVFYTKHKNTLTIDIKSAMHTQEMSPRVNRKQSSCHLRSNGINDVLNKAAQLLLIATRNL